MIGFSKLLCGTATVAEALSGPDGGSPRESSADLLRFGVPRGPLVVWNVTAACNLRCLHCYGSAEAVPADEELSTNEGKALIDDLARLGTPVLLFSGGEPLLRPDLLELVGHARLRGIRPVISTNGTLLTRETAEQMNRAGVAYVGVSLDGAAENHDRLRQRSGAFQEALAGLTHAREAGLKTGLRMTVTRENLADVDAVLEVVEEERVPRFCLYHLVYAGRGRDLAARDLSPAERRGLVERLIVTALEWFLRGVPCEILTTAGPADGVLVSRYVETHEPERADEVRRLLKLAGGCSAGRKFACVGPTGEVHPCQFWTHVSLGNVRERPFSAMWTDTDNPLLAKLRALPEHLAGSRCGACRYKDQCGGCRVRAEAVHGDPWDDDPACYLTDEEIGLVSPEVARLSRTDSPSPNETRSRNP